MKRLLKYLLSLMIVAVFWNCKDETLSAVPQPYDVQTIEESVCDNVISASESELCLPRQVSYANPSVARTTARRTAGCSRVNAEFAKAGKIINTGLRYSIQTKSILIHSSLMKPAQKLLYLGVLII